MKTISRFTAVAIIALSAFAMPVSASAATAPTSSDVVTTTGFSSDLGAWFCRNYGAWCPR
ncbi:hypothetical protein [Neomicrococcus lactis]|uniref:hypothetical protein n=1 Tax=Neomicrococcus lactis TaxID=732241 RepID=UPI002301984A|nr:hypothetical protein [Neomicrococcus lactis]